MLVQSRSLEESGRRGFGRPWDRANTDRIAPCLFEDLADLKV